MANKFFRNLHFAAGVLYSSIFIASLSGCASVQPPSAELDRATIALTSAQSELTENFAPVELRLARDALTNANSLVLAGKNELAKVQAERCVVYSELAILKADAGTARAEVAQQNDEIMQLKRQIDAGNRPVEGLELPPTRTEEQFK